MNKESLEKVQEKIGEILNDIDIPIYDKIELLINLIHFIDPEEYNENIKILSKKILKKEHNYVNIKLSIQDTYFS